jgi:hypothetical protein
MLKQHEQRDGTSTKNLKNEEENPQQSLDLETYKPFSDPNNYEDRIKNPDKHYKACKVCGKDKLLSDFPYARRRIDRRETHCKDCCSEQRKRAEKYYPIMVEKHGAFCHICGVSEEENGKRLAVDHCHKTGKVRGLLCDNHNHGIGKFNEDVELLHRAIQYLEKHKEQ